jgi:hypothetical protein
MTFEDQLRDALRPLDPGPRFAERVMAGIESGTPVQELAATVPGHSSAAGVSRAARWVGLALAASMTLVTAAGLGFLETQRRADGERARQQVLTALRVASDQLNEVGRRLGGDDLTRQHPAQGGLKETVP